MRRLTLALMADGLRVFVFSFHSPSVMPGGTPYVRNDGERERFLEKCRCYFDFFLRGLNGTKMTPLELKNQLASTTSPRPAEDPVGRHPSP